MPKGLVCEKQRMSLAAEFSRILGSRGHAEGYNWVTPEEEIAAWIRIYHREIHDALILYEKRLAARPTIRKG